MGLLLTRSDWFADLWEAAAVVRGNLHILEPVALIYGSSSTAVLPLERRVPWCLLASVDLRGVPLIDPDAPEFGFKEGVN